MSWNTSVLLANGKTLSDMEDIIPDVFEVTDRLLNWEDAISSSLGNDLALGQIKSWGVLWTPNFRVTMDSDILETSSRKGQALSIYFAGVSDYYGFCLYVNGKEVRYLIRERGEITEERGEPLPEESKLDWEDPEESLMKLAKKRTKIDVFNFDKWSDIQYKVATI